MASTQTTALAARREELNRTTEQYKQALEDQVSVLKQDASKAGRTALVVGGAALGTYLLAKAVTSIANRKKKKRHQPASTYAAAYGLSYHYDPHNPAVAKPTSKPASPVGHLIRQQITLFLGAIARQAVTRAIQRIGQHDTKRTEPTYRT